MVFAAVLGIQAFLIVFIGPAFTAGAISGEKERQTYDLLRTTLLPAGALVRGKLISALGYVFLLVFASVPLQSVAFLLGGVALEELIISQLIDRRGRHRLCPARALRLHPDAVDPRRQRHHLRPGDLSDSRRAAVVGSTLGFVATAASSPTTPNWVEPCSCAVGWYVIRRPI